MALSYDHLFADLGKLVEVIDDLHGIANGDATIDLITMEDDINDQLIDETDLGDGLTPGARYDVLSGIPEMFVGFKGAMLGWISTLIGKCTRRIMDYDLVLAELDLTKLVTLDIVLEELYRSMVDTAGVANEDIDMSTVTLNPNGVVSTVDGDGDGIAVNTTLLDGVTSPSGGWPVFRMYAYDLDKAPGSGRVPGEHIAYVGTLSELAVASETMTLTCTSDSETSGATEGSETFSWDGEEGAQNYGWEAEGSGEGPGVSVANGAGLIANGEFEDFSTTDTPDSWDVDAGVVGTDIFEEGTVVHRGSKALKFFGVVALTDHQISQTITNLTPLKRYFVGVWIKTSGVGIDEGDLTIQFEGTGYTAGTVEKITMTTGELAAQVAFTTAHYNFFVTMPADIPSDMELVIKIENTLADGESVYIDGLVLAPVVYHGGVGLAIMAGNSKFLIGDRMTFTVANDNAGTFQKFFRKAYRIQMPSVGDASETNADGLAE